MKSKILIVAIVGVCALALAGCHEEPEAPSVVASGTKVDDEVVIDPELLKGLDEQKEEDQEPLLVIGEETDDSKSFRIANNTEEDIIAVSVKSNTDEEYGDNMMQEGDVFAADTEAILYIQPVERADDETYYMLQVTLADETVFELSQVPVDDMKFCQIFMDDDGIGYLEYKSLTTREEKNTLAKEKEYQKTLAEMLAEEEAQDQTEEEAGIVDTYTDYGTVDYEAQDYSNQYFGTTDDTTPTYTTPTYTTPDYTTPDYTTPDYTTPVETYQPEYPDWGTGKVVD